MLGNLSWLVGFSFSFLALLEDVLFIEPLGLLLHVFKTFFCSPKNLYFTMGYYIYVDEMQSGLLHMRTIAHEGLFTY